MRHNVKKGLKLGTDASHTKAMKKSLAKALFENDRIKTTETRAKALRSVVDPIITWAKKGDLHSRRLAIAKLGDKQLVAEIFDKAAQGMWQDRNGGYTRIMKLGNRKGDNAPIVIMELVTEPCTPKAKKAAPAPKKAAAPKKVEAAEEAPAEEAPAEETPAKTATPITDALEGLRVLELEGYDMVNVPTDIISYDNDAVMNYIQEFANFTQVPRPSYDTDKMTEYLKVWAAARGIDCVADEAGNVIMNLPATEGYEDAPVVIFQGHIDMVPDTDEGVVHDWANDPLDLIWTSNTLKADGTSLGADNGSGVAFMLTYMDYADELTHGPLRFIFTVDEEVGLLGAAALDVSPPGRCHLHDQCGRRLRRRDHLLRRRRPL